MHWLEERSDIVLAKGKGELQTSWLEMDSNLSSRSILEAISEMESDGSRHKKVQEQTARVQDCQR
jgi:DNA-binding HxlR family transcriptional regulator